MASRGRRLRDVPADKVIKAFERLGYEVARIKGSQVILRHPSRPTLSIPRHRRVKTGLLLSKIKAAGATFDEFEELL